MLEANELEHTVKKIKIFKGIESELHPLEDEINSWLESSGSELISVTGNIAPQTNTSSMSAFSASDVLIIVTYLEKK